MSIHVILSITFLLRRLCNFSITLLHVIFYTKCHYHLHGLLYWQSLSFLAKYQYLDKCMVKARLFASFNNGHLTWSHSILFDKLELNNSICCHFDFQTFWWNHAYNIQLILSRQIPSPLRAGERLRQDISNQWSDFVTLPASLDWISVLLPLCFRRLHPRSRIREFLSWCCARPTIWEF